MQVHRNEGVAIHIGPESCAGGREAVREALTGERVGQRALPPVRLRNIPSPGGQRAICPSLNLVVQIRNLAIKDRLPGRFAKSSHPRRERPRA